MSLEQLILREIERRAEIEYRIYLDSQPARNQNKKRCDIIQRLARRDQQDKFNRSF